MCWLQLWSHVWFFFIWRLDILLYELIYSALLLFKLIERAVCTLLHTFPTALTRWWMLILEGEIRRLSFIRVNRLMCLLKVMLFHRLIEFTVYSFSQMSTWYDNFLTTFLVNVFLIERCFFSFFLSWLSFRWDQSINQVRIMARLTSLYQ